MGAKDIINTVLAVNAGIIRLSLNHILDRLCLNLTFTPCEFITPEVRASNSVRLTPIGNISDMKRMRM